MENELDKQILTGRTCPSCNLGKLYFSNIEFIRKVMYKVYTCDKCKALYKQITCIKLQKPYRNTHHKEELEVNQIKFK